MSERRGSGTLSDAGGLVRAYSDDDAAFSLQVSIYAFALAFLLFIGTVASVAAQAKVDPPIPSFVQWALCLAIVVVVAGARALLGASSDGVDQGS